MMITPLVGMLINVGLAMWMLVMYLHTGTPFTLWAFGFCSGTSISLLFLYMTTR
jgi:hypothetical protein